MRILHYNWVDLHDSANRGGGVTIYLRNLMGGLGAREGVHAAFLSSGLTFDLPARAPRWEAVRGGDGTRLAESYEIVNSGTLAPGHHSFGHRAQLSHPATETAFCDMVAATGPYDVVHFHNLEGVPLATLAALKLRFPDIRIVVSLHNYYTLCPQVNLWQRESAHCDDFRDGHACPGCLLHQPNARLVKLAHGLGYRLRRAGLRPGSSAYKMAMGTALQVGQRASRAVGWVRRRGRMPAASAPKAIPQRAEDFAVRRQRMVEGLNAHADLVMGVSDRVCEIAAAYGIDRDKLALSYIGTREASRFAETAPRGPLPGPDGSVHLAYLGYMRRDKGFFFLLEALEALPDILARRVRLTVAAKRGPAQAMVRIEALRSRLGALHYRDGYTHSGLDALLSDVDVGLIPVLWEDNLPQVAIEMHARHVPLLTSDRGGARELARCPDMVFAAGDIGAFHDRLEAILAGSIDMDAYWAGARAPQGMTHHLDEILSLYAGL